MLKNYVRNNRTKIMVLFSSTIFVIFFPFLMTSLKQSKNTTNVYKIDKMNKNIIFQSGEEKTSMDIEEFIPCVLYAMLPEQYEEEALKAQIVIIRTYIMLKMGNNDSINISELTVPYTSYSNLQKKWGKLYEQKYNKTMKLLHDTAKQIMKYEGNVIYPYYHEISAGSTANGEYGYLKSVDSKIDLEGDNYLNISYYTPDEISEKIKSTYTITIPPQEILKKILITKNTDDDYVNSVTIQDKVISADEFKNIFQLNSSSFTMEEYADGIKIVTKGIGNGKGLSLYGAMKMAQNGKNYDEILKYYYTGITIE